MQDTILEVSSALAAALRPGDLDETLRQITAAAADVLPGADHASINVVHHDGRVETLAPTDDRLLELDATQYSLHEGPCYDAVATTDFASAPDLAHDGRYPRYGQEAVRLGIRAQAGLRLFEDRSSVGSLNVYSETTGAFEDVEQLGRVFADHASTARRYAVQLGNLASAVETRQLIGQAVGITMERYDLDEARAFAFLTRVSAAQEVKVREVARRLVDERRPDQA